MSQVPYYLRPNDAVSTPKFGVIDVTAENDVNDISVNYSAQSQGLWNELAGDLSKAGGYVWNATTGAWESVKGAGEKAAKSLMDMLGDWFDMIKMNLLMAVGILLLIIWVIAKSGILKQINLTMAV